MEDIINEVVPKIGVYFEEYKDIYTMSSFLTAGDKTQLFHANLLLKKIKHLSSISFRRPEAEAQSIELLLHFSQHECGNSIDFLALLMDGVKWTSDKDFTRVQNRAPI
ncbi:hypothetical protein AB3S75_026662 [Citrus x aurantiifolia]